MTTAPLPQPPVIPVIQRKAPVEKPYKIIAPAKKEPDSVVTDASPAAPAPSNGPIRKVEPAVRNGLKRPHEDTVDGVDGEVRFSAQFVIRTTDTVPHIHSTWSTNADAASVASPTIQKTLAHTHHIHHIEVDHL